MTAPQSRRQFVLHIGTHKTGTTAIQLELEDRASSLAQQGILVPRTGLLNACGHHAVAEAIVHGSADSAPPELRALLEELESSRLAKAVVSSENFSLLFAAPERLALLAREIAATGYDTTVVLYVREQAALAESLYAELLKHGLLWSFDTFVEMVLDRGQVDATERLHFPFDYELLARRFEDAFGAGRVCVRRYRADAPSEVLLEEFWSTLGARRTESYDVRRPNQRFTMLEALDALYRSVAARDEGAVDPPTLARDAGISDPSALDRPIALLDMRDVERFRERFARSNRALEQKYGIAVGSELERVSFSDAGQRVFRAAATRWKL